MDPEGRTEQTVMPDQRGEPDIPMGYRLHNGVLLPAEQPAITRLMTAAKPTRPRRRWLLLGAGVVVLLVVIAIVASRSPVEQPAREKAFLAAIAHAEQRVRSGNDVTLVSARMQRSREICRLLPEDRSVRGWRGTIHGIDTAGGGAGVITVTIGDDTDLRTGHGFAADAKTQLRPGSAVYESVAQLHDGDQVVFSGRFVGDPDTCIHEMSLLQRNTMLSPDFEFLFSQVKAP